MRNHSLRALIKLLLAAGMLPWLACACLSVAHGQDAFGGVDLLYPEFAHPQPDAQAAIKRGDFRFIVTDRHQTAPGVERYPRLKEIYGTKVIRQRFRIFATRSQNFSFNLRARAYAEAYNRTMLHYLLREQRRH